MKTLSPLFSSSETALDRKKQEWYLKGYDEGMIAGELKSMARIKTSIEKYIDEQGEHTGTLTGAEYYIYSASNPESVALKPHDRVPYFSWQHTDYAPFKRAVENKYNTTVSKAWITK